MTLPSKQSRKWVDYKYRYTTDDGKIIVTSQRISKDENGNFFLAPTASLEEVRVNDTKTKFWGKPENLRRLEITYTEPRNQNGRGQLTRYIPFRPTARLIDYVQEVRDALGLKFNDFEALEYCLSYRGENRTTTLPPQSLESAL